MTPTEVAQQIVLDVLAERGPPMAGVPFRMCAVEPDDLPAQRAALARRFARMVPDGTTLADVPRVASGIVPFLAEHTG